ncbi:hypothetical protein OCU04_012343 [Sclerotinia nivalis]|uniref:Uncharacterized protein n=1 Tax=Sclerotinia nivalis TaxID=352851 RepID=A0A9X0AAZ1_9HELO|nr:hypothetical protein OCU04_012343 [Sclerotinia nivalis]
MSSETENLSRSHTYRSERDLVDKMVDVILERNALRDTVKARDLSLQASHAQISQLEAEKVVLEKGARKLAKYEEQLKDSGLEGVEEVIDGMEFLKNALGSHRDRADAAEKALKNALDSQRNRADAAEKALNKAGASSIAEDDQPK